MIRLLPMLAIALTAGCAVAQGVGVKGVPAGDVPRGDMADTCSAKAYQHLVGEGEDAVTAEGLEAGPKVRIFGPDAMLTLDHRPDRLNIKLDSGDRVIDVYCG